MKNVLILGASSAVAQPLVKLFSIRGYSLHLAARNCNRLLPIKNDLSIRKNVKVELYEFDVENYDSHVDFYGGLKSRPDIVICLFGFLGEQSLGEKKWIHAKRILEVNFIGAVSILNLVAQEFSARKSGVIVGVSSVAGDRGRQSNYLYGSSKAGFTAYLSGLRNSLFKNGVHVVTVKPGFIDSRMTIGVKKIKALTASPEIVANSILRSIDKRRDIIYVLWVWRWIMLIIKLIPERIFKYLKL
jgi:decaprenylphospho-beta-D-erythro-pentofuranosid-2-ulose 2-reductase